MTLSDLKGKRCYISETRHIKLGLQVITNRNLYTAFDLCRSRLGPSTLKGKNAHEVTGK